MSIIRIFWLFVSFIGIIFSVFLAALLKLWPQATYILNLSLGIYLIIQIDTIYDFLLKNHKFKE